MIYEHFLHKKICCQTERSEDEITLSCLSSDTHTIPNATSYAGKIWIFFVLKQLQQFLLSYGLKPIPPSKVSVSPVKYLKSGCASCTQTRPISSSESP